MRFNKIILVLVACIAFAVQTALPAYAAAKPATPENLEPLPEAQS